MSVAGTATVATGILSLVAAKGALEAEKNLEVKQSEARDVEQKLTKVKSMLDNFKDERKKLVSPNRKLPHERSSPPHPSPLRAPC